MNFSFKDYWPKPSLDYSISQEGTNFDGTTLKSTFALNPNDINIIWQDDYIDGVWQARWILQYDTPNGVIESADIYPAKTYQFWTGKRTTAFVSGKEIWWGGKQQLGDIVEHPCQISWWKSTLFTPGIKGNQIVEFYDHYARYTVADGTAQYKDVLEVMYDQTWNGRTTGARMWYAKDIGIVQLSWRSEFEDTEMIKKPMVYNFSQIEAIKS